MNKIDWVRQALNDGVTNIGQIPKNEILTIKRLVKAGILKQGLNWNFPKPKNYYSRSLMCKTNITEA